MAFKHGIDGEFFFDGDGDGTVTALTSYLTSLSLAQEVDVAETSVFGDTSRSYIVGLADGTISGEGLLDITADSQFNQSLRAIRAFEFYPQGSASGSIKLSGSMIVMSYEREIDIGEAGIFSFEGQQTGGITRGTV